MADNKDGIENVIIIGGGPAGLAAAIYNSRAQLSPLVFAGSPPGGQLTLTTEVENYPGFESILGPELVEKMRTQAKKFGTRIIDENVVKVDFSKRPYKTYTTNKAYWSNAVLVATGAKALWLGLESETRLRGKGVSACATCDAFFFKGKTVAVVGGGDTAMEEALTLTKFAEKVYIIHRRAEFRASKIMQERVLNHPKIEIIWNAVVEEILGEKKVEGVKLKILDTRFSILDKMQNIKHLSSNIYNLTLDGLFVAIGHKPDTDIFKGKIELDQKGYIVTNSKFQYTTSVPGVFAAGDCVDHVYRQAATAVGMGVAAALEIERWLNQ
jgi:thioredoxin reductase (NADPH)